MESHERFKAATTLARINLENQGIDLRKKHRVIFQCTNQRCKAVKAMPLLVHEDNIESMSQPCHECLSDMKVISWEPMED